MNKENTLAQLLIDLNACEEARVWAGDKTIEEVVSTCPKGEWLLNIAAIVGIDRQPIALTAGHCVNTVRHKMEDKRSIHPVDVVIAFGEGKATLQDLKAARAAASAAYYAAWAAYFAVGAAWGAACDAADAAGAAARAADNPTANQLQTADICRQYIGQLIIDKVNELLNQ